MRSLTNKYLFCVKACKLCYQHFFMKAFKLIKKKIHKIKTLCAKSALRQNNEAKRQQIISKTQSLLVLLHLS